MPHESPRYVQRLHGRKAVEEVQQSSVICKITFFIELEADHIGDYSEKLAEYLGQVRNMPIKQNEVKATLFSKMLTSVLLNGVNLETIERSMNLESCGAWKSTSLCR